MSVQPQVLNYINYKHDSGTLWSKHVQGISCLQYAFNICILTNSWKQTLPDNALFYPGAIQQPGLRFTLKPQSYIAVKTSAKYFMSVLYRAVQLGL